MNSQKSHKHLPPYISYRTYRNFISRLQQQIPARIDRSYWGDTLSGSTGTQLMTALRFLALIDNNGKPSERLRLLVSAKGAQQIEILREIAMESYGFVLHGSLDIQNATYAQLEEVFHDNFQLTPAVCRKCIKFFVSLATDARLTLSPFMTKRFRRSYASDGITGTKNTIKKVKAKANQNLVIPYHPEKVPEDVSWHSMLLAKFPTFDPSWGEEVKAKWFTAFGELLKLNPVRGDNRSTD